MSRGRPPATYADPFIKLARQAPGQWWTWVLDRTEHDVMKIKRKASREGLVARAAHLDDDYSLLAVRTANHNEDPPQA